MQESRSGMSSSLMVLVIMMVSTFAMACDEEGSKAPASLDAPRAEVVREPILTGSPDNAPGQILGLERVVFPPGAEAEPHSHPGMQLATVLEGSLRFTVLRGAVSLTRAD